MKDYNERTARVLEHRVCYWVVGSCALNVDTGENRLGLSMAEAVQLSARVHTFDEQYGQH